MIEKSAGMPIVAPMHTYVRNAIKDLGNRSPEPSYHASAELSFLRISDQ